MRIVVSFIFLTLFSLSSSFALQQNCNFCSQANADYYNDQLSEQDYNMMFISFIDPDNQLFVASDEKIDDDVQLPSLNAENEFRPLLSMPTHIENILEFIKHTENIKSFDDKTIDLLANFRNGDDIVVPIGFFLYINKKF